MSDIASASNCTIKSELLTKADRLVKPKTISVNGVTIARDAIARETQNHPAAKPIEAWLAAARALVVRELLLQEARRLGLTAEPATDDEGRRETDEEALIRTLVEREVATPEPDDAICRRYYEQNKTRFRSPALCEVSHILIPAASGSPNEADAKQLADDILETLARDGATFEALAHAHSICPSRDAGGNLGQIGPGQTVPEFEAALATMTANAIHFEPVRTRYGFHIVRMGRRVDSRELPFDIARPLIAAFLAERVQRVAQRQYVSLLAGRARIEGIALDAAASPLLQ
jgi:peptidyl-prolyl cis-trans isomerase C